jgi:ABC-type multidrug transport system permease subunit
MWSDASFIARRDLAYMLRQRDTLLWVFAMPVLFFYFIGTVTGGFGSQGTDQRDALALQAPPDGGVIVDEIARRLEEQQYRVVRPRTPEDLARYSRRVLIPAPATHADVTEAVLAGEALTVTLERRGEELAANFDQVRVSRAVYTVLADLAVLKTDGRPVSAEAFAALAAAPRRLTLTVTSAGRRQDPPSGFAQTVPGTMVMFTMLVLLTSGAILLVVEREQGLLRRLASTPISRGSIVLGKWSARMALALVQIGFAMALGRVLFRVQWGDTLWMVAVVLGAWAAFNASLALVLGSLARSQPQAAGIGVLGTMILAALGGCWWPIEVTPQWAQSLSLALPTGWTMSALHRLISFQAGAIAAVPHLVALVVAALVIGAVATRTFRYA